MSTAKLDTATGSTTITIPSCTATHVLGNTSLPLAEGQLALLTAPLLTLQVGARAFPLPGGTPFGTDASNQRAYLFVPVGLDAQDGHVRIELPPDVAADTHADFERVLIAAGLLVEGDGDGNGNGGAGTWLGRKVEDIKGAVAGGLSAEGGGVPAEAIEGSDDEGKGRRA